MERSITEAQASLKLLDVNVGRETGDKREIIRRTIEEIRHYVKEVDLGYYDRVIRRTRIVIMGRGTVRWEQGNEAGYSVPTLFQCRDRRDQEELEGILRAAGYFPAFHWPKEAMEFVSGVRAEVRKQGIAPERYHIRVRPETRNGTLMIKAEVKPKDGSGRFVLKGLWSIPPQNNMLWDGISDLYENKLGARMETS